MDAAPPEPEELFAALSLGGNSAPHSVAAALSVLLPLLPLDLRARAACVCRAWRAAAARPELWEELDFEGCTARVSGPTLASLCARAGAALRSLHLDWYACRIAVTPAGVLAALRKGGCTGLRRINVPYVEEEWSEKQISREMAQQLAAACPLLQHTECTVHCDTPAEAAGAATALPGPLTIYCPWGESESELTQLIKYMRDNTSLTSLKLCNNRIGVAGATQLAECLRVNASLKILNLENDIGDAGGIGDAGATQLAESLRFNATLTSLILKENNIGVAGATRLAECLRVNATLTNLVLDSNDIGAAGAAQMAECLRVNATLTSLNLYDSKVGAVGVAQLAQCLRVNSTLTNLDLGFNEIGDAGVTQLAECLHVNATLTSLYLWQNNISNIAIRALQAAYQPHRSLHL